MNARFPLVLAESTESVLPFILIVGGLVLLTALLVGIGYFFERRRYKRLAARATASGFTFRRKGTAADRALLADSYLGARGHSDYMWNVIEAPPVNDFSMTLLEFWYTDGFGKSQKTIMQTVIRMQSPLLELPTFVLRPESVLAKVAQIAGYQDIDFPDAPQFSKRHLLRGKDEPAIRQVFTPAILRYCEQHPKISIEGAGDRLLVYWERKRLKPANFDTFVDEGKAIAALFVGSSRGVPASG